MCPSLQCPGLCISNKLTPFTAPNNDTGIDGMVSILTHELAEAASDPTASSWYSGATGDENADKCAFR